MPAGIVQHVVNRGNRRERLFDQPIHYQEFVDLLAVAADRVPMRLLAYCLMPNHWHLVLWPSTTIAMSAYLHWLTSTHVRRTHRRRGTTGLGHIYQERYRNSPVDSVPHLITVLRYVESNPVRANLVERAEEWPWSSLTRSCASDGTELLSPWPMDRPEPWTEIVNQYAR